MICWSLEKVISDSRTWRSLSWGSRTPVVIICVSTLGLLMVVFKLCLRKPNLVWWYCLTCWLPCAIDWISEHLKRLTTRLHNLKCAPLYGLGNTNTTTSLLHWITNIHVEETKKKNMLSKKIIHWFKSKCKIEAMHMVTLRDLSRTSCHAHSSSSCSDI